MSKTYRLYTKKTALKISDGIYDRTSDTYTLESHNGCYLEFEDMPDALKNITPIGKALYFHAKKHTDKPYSYAAFFRLSDILNIENDVFPQDMTYVNASTIQSQAFAWNHIITSENVDVLIKGLYLAIYMHSYVGLQPIITHSANSEYKPYLELTYSEGPLDTLADKPKGYVARTKPVDFSWHTTYPGFPVENITQTSATLQWKNGEGGTVNGIAISGSSTRYTMPANLLPKSDGLYWRVVASTAEGNTNPEWTRIRTTDALSTAAAISPSGVYVDGTKTTRFVWEHSTATGTTQTAYDLQIKTGVEGWTTVKTETTGNQFCDLPANILPSGTVQWRVRTYNADSASGEWSNALTVVVIAAPQAPSVQIDVVSPRPKISWTSQDQQAYQVQIGSYDSGLVFGTEKSFRCPVYLPNGSTRAHVRVLNEYNLWSVWSEVLFTIANIPGTEPVLTIDAGCDANLTWSSVTNAAAYWIYRDQKCIAKVTAQDYVDRLAIGSHTYFVRAVYAESDNYTDSNTVAATLSTDHPIICELGGEWISLKLSTSSMPSVQVSVQQNIALSQYAGSEYPMPEISPYKQRDYNIYTAYMAGDMRGRTQFERLLGKRVCVKDQYENLVVGIITSYQKTSTTFYTAYTAVVNEIDEGDYRAND